MKTNGLSNVLGTNETLPPLWFKAWQHRALPAERGHMEAGRSSCRSAINWTAEDFLQSNGLTFYFSATIFSQCFFFFSDMNEGTYLFFIDRTALRSKYGFGVSFCPQLSAFSPLIRTRTSIPNYLLVCYTPGISSILLIIVRPSTKIRNWKKKSYKNKTNSPYFNH